MARCVSAALGRGNATKHLQCVLASRGSGAGVVHHVYEAEAARGKHPLHLDAILLHVQRLAKERSLSAAVVDASTHLRCGSRRAPQERVHAERSVTCWEERALATLCADLAARRGGYLDLVPCVIPCMRRRSYRRPTSGQASTSRGSTGSRASERC